MTGGPALSRMAWVQATRQPELALAWSLAEWERVVRLARRLRLLARLAQSLTDAGLLEQVPAQPRRHLLADQRVSLARTTAMTWTLQRVGAVLGDAPYPKVLLKGAAYVGQDLRIAGGRMPSDVDILVPHAHIGDAQARLVQAGWSEDELDDHDRTYYHNWSHEVPPMRHPVHPIELDLHHNILPPVARTHVDADLLLQRLRPSRWTAWHVLDPADQVLHSAAHLFQDSEARDRVRDLVDLDGLLRHFGTETGFWEWLPKRALELGLTEQLALASHFCMLWIGTPIPAQTAETIAALGPPARRRAWLLPLLTQVLTPTEPDDMPALTQHLAASVLLARYHLHRMPLRMLVPHLWHKLRMRNRAGVEDATAEAQR